jgi:hypothetical protein
MNAAVAIKVLALAGARHRANPVIASFLNAAALYINAFSFLINMIVAGSGTCQILFAAIFDPAGADYVSRRPCSLATIGGALIVAYFPSPLSCTL